MCDSKFREMPFRFLGYGMAVGQSIRYMVSPEAVLVCDVTSLVFSGSHVMCVLFNDPGTYMDVLKTATWEIVATVCPAVIVHFAHTLIYHLLYDVKPELTGMLSCFTGLVLCVQLYTTIDNFADGVVTFVWG